MVNSCYRHFPDPAVVVRITWLQKLYKHIYIQALHRVLQFHYNHLYNLTTVHLLIFLGRYLYFIVVWRQVISFGRIETLVSPLENNIYCMISNNNTVDIFPWKSFIIHCHTFTTAVAIEIIIKLINPLLVWHLRHSCFSILAPLESGLILASLQLPISYSLTDDDPVTARPGTITYPYRTPRRPM